MIRNGRLTEAQKKAFNNGWENYGLSLFSGRLDQKQVFGRSAPLVVEVGFGSGDSLLKMAVENPEVDFLGIEVYVSGVGQLVNNSLKKGVRNLRIYMADAVDVLQECLLDNSITRFQLFFPDPWHKKKHHKRRIVQPHFVDIIRRKLILGGICHFATDWQDYADEMMSIMTTANGFSNQAGGYNFSPKPYYRPETKFEQRGERLGHGVKDLIFKRTV